LIPADLNIENINKTYQNLTKYVQQTPFIKGWSLIDEILDTNAYFKLEFLQNSGTFKARGATNNILNLSNKTLKKGITAVSAGNHAIAASYVANLFRLKNKIFIYKSANPYKIKKCQELKANLYFTDPHTAFKNVEKAFKNEGYYFLHPFDGPLTLQGTASLGLEIFNQIKEFENILISVGGGGLISGIGSAIKQLNPSCKIIGIEPKGACGLTKSLKNNKPLKNVQINTIADSLSSPLHMEYSFDIAKHVIDEMVTVSDNEIKKSMKFMFEYYKLILEPACVATIAALLGPLKNKLTNQKTVILLCGSNIDAKTWMKLVN
tara:strand:+ start:736 stop:1698 length:963 start_codon:yes stop_codon:yes gene_type:complete